MLRDREHTDDAVYRGADIVAHAAQKICFCDVCALCILGCEEKLTLVFKLLVLFFIVFKDNEQNACDLARAVAVLGDISQKIPCVIGRADIDRNAFVFFQTVGEG